MSRDFRRNFIGGFQQGGRGNGFGFGFGGPMQRGGMGMGNINMGMAMGNPNFRNQNQYPFQNRGPQMGNTGNFGKPNLQQVQITPQKPQQQSPAPQVNRSGPTPGPALTMKGPTQQQQASAVQQAAAVQQTTAAAAQPKTPSPPTPTPPKPAITSPPPKAEITSPPPKPVITPQPKPAVTPPPKQVITPQPKPAVTPPPKPVVTAPPPKPAVTAPPPKPAVTAPPPKPVVTAPPPKPVVTAPPPKPVVTAPPPKPVVTAPPPKPVITSPPPKPIMTPQPKPTMSSPPPNQMNKNQNPNQHQNPNQMNKNQGHNQHHNPNQMNKNQGQNQHQNPNQMNKNQNRNQHQNPNQMNKNQNQNQQKSGFGGQNQKAPTPPVKKQEAQKRRHEPDEEIVHPTELKATLCMLLKPGEKSYTQRCRLFIGNMPNDITDEEFKKLFAKYGEPSEIFINKMKGFGFIRLESRALAEIAKAELDDKPMKGRQIRVRFATHPAALSVKNLSPYVSNELLEDAFSQFGVVERAVVIVDDRGRSTGKGIVEFASKPAARKALDRCSDGIFLLTTAPRPIIVEPLEQYDDEDGLPEKLASKNPRYQKERDDPPRFARPGTFEFEYSKRWKSLDEMEKQQRQQVEKNIREAREKLEGEMDDAFHEHQANMLRQDLLRRQEELRRMEEMHSQEMQKRKEMQLRQEEQRRLREEEMLRQREMEEQMRRQREENYRNYMDSQRERAEMRLSANSGSMGMTGAGGDMQYGSPQAQKKFPMAGSGYEGHQNLTASTAGSTMTTEMQRNERFPQNARGMATSNQGFGRVREEFDGQAKKPRF